MLQPHDDVQAGTSCCTMRQYGEAQKECGPRAWCHQRQLGVLLERSGKRNTAELVWWTIRDVLSQDE